MDSLLNGLLTVSAGMVMVVVEATQRLFHPVPLTAGPVAWAAGAGIAISIRGPRCCTCSAKPSPSTSMPLPGASTCRDGSKPCCTYQPCGQCAIGMSIVLEDQYGLAWHAER